MKNFTLLILCGMLLTGCTQNIDSDVYTSSEVRQATRTYEGTIVSVRQVKLQNADKLTGNTEGLLLGGILGGVAGSAIGGGRGRAVATVAGAAAGGTAGAFAQDHLSKQVAIEYVVKARGQMYTIVQGKDIVYAPGQKVLIALGGKRPRIVSAIAG